RLGADALQPAPADRAVLPLQLDPDRGAGGGAGGQGGLGAAGGRLRAGRLARRLAAGGTAGAVSDPAGRGRPGRGGAGACDRVRVVEPFGAHGRRLSGGRGDQCLNTRLGALGGRRVSLVGVTSTDRLNVRSSPACMAPTPTTWRASSLPSSSRTVSSTEYSQAPPSAGCRIMPSTWSAVVLAAGAAPGPVRGVSKRR